MKGLFIPEITAEMFRNGCLESIEQLMAEGEIYDIEYSPWIPVTERLPQNVNDVLCWYIYSENDKLYQTYGIGFYWNEVWGGEKWYGERCKVIAWMPLPEPYNAENGIKR